MDMKLVGVIFFIAAVTGWALLSKFNSSPEDDEAVGVLAEYIEPNFNNSHMSQPAGEISEAKTPKQERSADDSMPVAANTPRAKEVKTLSGTPSESEVVRKWSEERGKFFDGALADYETYDIATLEQLVKSGDIKAMTVLTAKYASAENALEHGEKILPLAKLAAVHGSTSAMAFMSSMTTTTDVNLRGPERRDDYIEALSWADAAALRGDRFPNYSATLEMKSAGIELTPAEVVKIRQCSEAIYNELLQERKELGLGDFNNEVPKEVENYFNNFQTYMDK